MPVKGALAMPYSLTVEPKLIRAVFSDSMTAADLRTLADELAAIERTLPMALDRLTDLSHVSDIQLTYPDMLAYVEHRRAQRLANPVKCALVASRPVGVGFARMFQTLSDHPQVTVDLFATLEEAEAWLLADSASGERDL